MGVITQDQLKEIESLETEVEPQRDVHQEQLQPSEEEYDPSSENISPSKPDDQEMVHEPLLFVDVNLGVGKQERIVVCEGDKADVLAENFARQHSNDFPALI